MHFKLTVEMFSAALLNCKHATNLKTEMLILNRCHALWARKTMEHLKRIFLPLGAFS